MKSLYEIRVIVQCEGYSGWNERSVHAVAATSRGMAEAEAKRQALAGRHAPYYAYVYVF